MNLIEKLIQILDYLNNVEKSVGITELSSKLSLPKSTVHRILKSLLKYSIVDQEKHTAKYRLGLGMLKYSNSFYNSFDFRQIAKQVLKKLCVKTKENASLMTWRNNKCICIDSFNPSKDVNMNLSIVVGQELPFHCTAAAKVLLAHQSSKVIRDLINEKSLQRYTSRTIVNPEELRKDLKEIRDNGFAFCYGELKEGVMAIAAPVRNINGEVIASISIAGIFTKVPSDNDLEKCITVVTNSAQEISEKLGYKKKGILGE